MKTLCKNCGGKIAEERAERGAVYCSGLCNREYKEKLRQKKVNPIEIIRNCKLCGKEIPKKRAVHRALYCSDACRQKYLRKLYKIKNPRAQNTSTATKGAISELRVAIDLLYKGYGVFRALSPSCPCDLAILEGDKLIRVEVKTAYYTSNTNNIQYPAPIKSEKYDILALVLHDRIIYQPTLEELFVVDF